MKLLQHIDADPNTKVKSNGHLRNERKQSEVSFSQVSYSFIKYYGISGRNMAVLGQHDKATLI